MFRGDNFVRYTGEVTSIAEKQLFAWEAGDHGADIHLQGEPTKLELMHKTFTVKRDNFKEKQNKSILEKVSSPASLFNFSIFIYRLLHSQSHILAVVCSQDGNPFLWKFLGL